MAGEGKRVLEAMHRLRKRGIEPLKLEADGDLFAALQGMTFGLKWEPVSGPSAVLGKRRHGKYEVVAYEREPVASA